MKKRLTLIWGICLVLLVACAAKADYDIRGTWNYTMIAEDGNTYDAGSITFSGQPTKGTYLEVNIYDVTYEGTYTVNGTTLELEGFETWTGTVDDATHISGTWSHDDGVSGTWSAVKSTP